MTAPVVELSCITKTYPGVVANDCVSLAVHGGEIHGILGENGAGKTTLMGVLYGLTRPDSGEIRIEGSRFAFRSPQDAIAAGIGMVQQHFALIPTLTVAENIALSDVDSPHLVLRLDQVRLRLRELSGRYGLSAPPDQTIEDLPIGIQQRVELLRVLYRSSRILILDEPTALLTPQESHDLTRVLRNLADAGTTIFFVSHKLEEVIELCDRISVMRRGRLIQTVSADDATPEALAEMMIGYIPERSSVGDNLKNHKKPRLAAGGLRARDARGAELLKDVTLDVRAGEIVGVAGLEGSGQVELGEAIAGLRELEAGEVILEGQPLTRLGPRQRAAAGIAYIPPDRRQWGLVLDFDIAHNLALRTYQQQPLSNRGWLDNGAINDHAQDLMRRFDIRAAGPGVAVINLSGGNQQKVVLARELSGEPKVIVSCYATRGLDVAAAVSVHDEILQQRSRGAAVLFMSTDLDELLALCDRIVVMHRGQIVGALDGKTATAEEIGLLMGGRQVKA